MPGVGDFSAELRSYPVSVAIQSFGVSRIRRLVAFEHALFSVLCDNEQMLFCFVLSVLWLDGRSWIKKGRLALFWCNRLLLTKEWT